MQGSVPIKRILLQLLLLTMSYGPAWADIKVQADVPVRFKLLGYDVLAERVIDNRTVAPGEPASISTEYRGLAILAYENGAQYPLIISDNKCSVEIVNPAETPRFQDCPENDSLYRLLRQEQAGDGLPYPRLLLAAKALIDSSYGIQSVAELVATKTAFESFVIDHLSQLRHSDLVRRFLAQYFMMHEYVSYHEPGEPPSAIRRKYQQAVLDGVGSWLDLLSPHIPRNEILNHLLSLYYGRSMVSLASLIAERYQQYAFCPGAPEIEMEFPDELQIQNGDGSLLLQFGQLPGKKIVSFVSADCAVSLVATVIQARRLASTNNDKVLLVVPLERLSSNHLSMARMVSGGMMFFINDDKLRNSLPSERPRLPYFQ